MGGRKVAEFTEEDREVLVKIVKAAQSRNVKGSKGEWKDFLKSSRQLRVGPSDPAKRPWTTLANFVRTFTDDAHIQMVKLIRVWELRKKKFEEFESEGIWTDSPEQELVRLTHQHRRFKEYYTFPSSDKGWVMTDLKKTDSPSKRDYILSLDCEMVVCDDNMRALVRVCVVDDEEKVLLDMLVKPRIPVIDYLTPITGICEADLKNVTCGILEAQTAVLKLLTANTILVGHSLHNDLNALKIDHPRVIDTSFLFQFRNKPESYNVGLNSLCKAVLGYEFRDDGKPHDCVLDATIPMRIVRHTLKHGIKGPIDIQEKMVDEGQLCKLYFHGIPQPVSVNDLQKLIPDDCSCDIDAISWAKNKSGTTFGVFSCINDANRVFEELTGLAGEDSYGRPQKTVNVAVFSKHGKLKKVPVRVRKMSTGDGVQGEGALQGEATAMECLQSAEDIESVSLKKRKVADGDSCVILDKAMNHCCEHFQEATAMECSQSAADIELKKRKVADGDSCVILDKAMNHCCEHFQEATAMECSQSAADIELKKIKFADGDSCVILDKAMNHCCEHFQEAESLRKQLREKIEEVHALQKIILDLTKEQF